MQKAIWILLLTLASGHSPASTETVDCATHLLPAAPELVHPGEALGIARFETVPEAQVRWGMPAGKHPGETSHEQGAALEAEEAQIQLVEAFFYVGQGEGTGRD